MPSLADAQRNFIVTVNEGPDALDAALFAGAPNRIILGLKAHANTISHARLIALEESFPMTRTEIGEDRFHALSRDYVEISTAKSCDLAQIGRHFAPFLQNAKMPAAIVDLATIEWAWLESYHAADASPLTLEAMSALAETDLLNLAVILHPSARICPLHAMLAASLAHLAAETEPSAILVIRPDAEVRLLTVDDRTLQAAQNCLQPSTIGNLLALASEQGYESDLIGPVLTLIGAGALVTME
ncbi:MAG: putative DNA-binding domain-containing protein [Sphingorhabdus sp.]|nr:putative DNA-binding domain-containing protein [Sphingorhabdus sp.]